MRAADRQHRILALARQEGRVEVTAAAADFKVAVETIRRDLSDLERRGLIRRTHGGAYPVESTGFETDLAQRVTRHVEAKRRIAAEAVKLVGEAESIFIDEGYTPQLLAALLPADRPLTVVTASLSTAAAVADSANMTVLLLGGRVRGRTMATVGSWACAMLSGFVIDLAFLGANGISRDLGLTTPIPWWPTSRPRPSRCPADGSSWVTTASSEPAASAASRRSATSRRSSPTPNCPVRKPIATRYLDRTSFGPEAPGPRKNRASWRDRRRLRRTRRPPPRSHVPRTGPTRPGSPRVRKHAS